MTLPEDMLAHNRQVIADFRANGGGEPGRHLLLLATTRARTGHKRTSPTMYIPDGDRLLVMQPNAGSPRHRTWTHTVAAPPDAPVETTAETSQARAGAPRGEERDRVGADLPRQYPFFTDHQNKVSRTIPVVSVERL